MYMRRLVCIEHQHVRSLSHVAHRVVRRSWCCASSDERRSVHLDYDTATTLREQHPAWRLLASGNAPLVVSFLGRVFVDANAREIRQADLVEALEDDLLHLRRRFGDDRYPKAARSYLDDWASADQGLAPQVLRCFLGRTPLRPDRSR